MNKHAYIFPGQGAQFPGMGKELYETNPLARDIFEKANEILRFRISDIMFNGSAEELKQTNVTQPAVFIHSVAAYNSLTDPKPDMVAGHSLGEFSALVANKTLLFEDALKLVSIRASAMQQACELTPSSMAAVLGMEDDKVEMICAKVQEESGEIVVPANYNCPGQLVISGTTKGVELALVALKEAGARKSLLLHVSGAFHSPLMQPAWNELSGAIEHTKFSTPICPVYQNVVAAPVMDPNEIKVNLENQLTGAVRWTQSVEAMLKDGAVEFTESGPGRVLQGLVHKINKDVKVNSVH